MTPRISPRFPPRRATSYEMFRDNEDNAPIESRAFWRWVTAPAQYDGGDAKELITEEEYRVLRSHEEHRPGPRSPG